MYFKFSVRQNPATQSLSGYYRLVESYRNADNRVCHHTILTVGFMEDTNGEQRNKIQKQLTDKYALKQTLWKEVDPIVIRYVNFLWQRILDTNGLDIKAIEKRSRMINIDTMEHEDVREIGAEWMCYNSWKQLGLDTMLQSLGWDEAKVQLATTHVISRAVYPASELKTTRWIKENSAVCELTNYAIEALTKDKLYQNALSLYAVKEELEKHLSTTTNDLFSLQDKIILYDLTNTYFEGSKRNSQLAKFGRSKEKRSDAKLVVLALVVNIEGFIKYSSIYEGNIADCDTLPNMVDKLQQHSGAAKPIVVIDSGIATQDNLHYLKENNYPYLCVTRAKLKDYEPLNDKPTVLLKTKSKQEIQLKAIQTKKHTDYFLEVHSPAKAIKETGMKTQFEQRFEQGLQCIEQALHKKSGIKNLDKVHERIGRVKERYPSVSQYYNINVVPNKDKQKAVAMHWEKDTQKQQQKLDSLGIYFLQTNLNLNDETVVWNIYNTIREIESTFRTLKTDLDLRPIYHKNDAATMAHLHLGLLAYWLVNTIRYQLKQKQINSSWSEIVRIGNTQKMITTKGQNTFESIIKIRKCSMPNDNLKTIYDTLKIANVPFRKQKFVVHKMK